MESPRPGELLYNGIRLPEVWPPRGNEVPTREPMCVPYLDLIPEVIPIDVGRQLFVDDFLIEPTALKRRYHQARYHPASPLLRPEHPWELENDNTPAAMVFSDGVWYDPADALFKIWYLCGQGRQTCYAVSQDGLHWEKPALDVVPGTNIVNTQWRDSNTVWLDAFERDPARRFKMFASHRSEGAWALGIFFSPDGVYWGEMVARSGLMGDRSSVFYNPFRRVWVYSIREYFHGRRRRYREHADVLEGARWQLREPPLWVGADRLDPWRGDLDIFPELYNLDAVAYESILLGLFSIWRGQPTDRPKPNEVCVGFSRDGFHWHRPDRRALVPVSEHRGDWNWGNVQSAGGGCLVMGDELWFYVSGRAGVPGSSSSGISTTGLAVLRRDGFASLDAGDEEASVTTRPLRFSGKRLFVNVEAPQGELRAEVLDLERNPIPPFTRDNCVPISEDATRAQVRWKHGADLSAFAGKPVRFRLHLRAGSLYAFWVSPDESGRSNGYVAAGGPGFTGPADA
jgi:hypothetical protein